MIHEHLLILNADCATAWKGEVLEGQERRGRSLSASHVASTTWLIAAFVRRHAPRHDDDQCEGRPEQRWKRKLRRCRGPETR
jgi:hypothetical protein